MIERLTTVNELPVDEIQIGERLRGTSPEGVENLIETITANGFVGRIVVRRTRKGDFVLDGAHRLTAMRQMGQSTIPCDLIRCSDDEALMFEIDGNIAGADMTALQLAYFLARRRETFQRLNPESRRGIAGATTRWDGTEPSSLAKTIAAGRGITERQVFKIMSAGATLGPDEYRRLSQAETKVKLKDLEGLAKITQTGERYYVIDALVKGTVKNAAAARKLYSAEQGDAPRGAMSPADAEHRRLDDAWRHASKAARRRFLEGRGDEVGCLLAEMQEDEVATLRAEDRKGGGV